MPGIGRCLAEAALGGFGNFSYKKYEYLLLDKAPFHLIENPSTIIKK